MVLGIVSTLIFHSLDNLCIRDYYTGYRTFVILKLTDLGFILPVSVEIFGYQFSFSIYLAIGLIAQIIYYL